MAEGEAAVPQALQRVVAALEGVVLSFQGLLLLPLHLKGLKHAYLRLSGPLEIPSLLSFPTGETHLSEIQLPGNDLWLHRRWEGRSETIAGTDMTTSSS